MTFRYRLVLALMVAVLLPLPLLLWSVQSVIHTGVESLAPESSGDALRDGLELARGQLESQRESLHDTLHLLMTTLPPPGELRADSLSPLHASTLYYHSGDFWYQWRERGWIASPPPPDAPEAEFGVIPDRLQVQETDVHGDSWTLNSDVSPEFRETAARLQRAAQDWAITSRQRERLIVSLTTTFIVTCLIAMGLAVLAGLLVLAPLTRRIARLTEVAESIRTGNEEVRADESGGGEIQRLARTFNLMLERLVESRRHAAEMEKRAAWRELAPVLAHEIKNPLTPIQLSVQQLAESYPGGDERYAKTLRDAREIVDEEVERLRKLVRDFGDFARAPAPEPERINLTEFMHDFAALYGDRVEVLDRSLSAGEAKAHAWFDREQVRRALVNLAENAFAAAGGDGRVRLTCDRLHDQLRFIVEDSGPGVPDDKHKAIFEPYFTTKSNGIGLGLPVVRTTAEQHGGRVWVERSEELGGAKFVLVLTLTAPHASPLSFIPRNPFLLPGTGRVSHKQH